MAGKKLNLGCGDHHPKGWINADIQRRCNPDVLLPRREPGNTACGPLPWEDGTFSQVLISHVLEHIRLEEVDVFLGEVRRVTKIGGHVLIICPDIKELLRDFLSPEGFKHGWEMTNEALFFEFVLEDDRHRIKDNPAKSELPPSDHRWNTYGSRLLEKVRRTFPDSKLLGTTGPVDYEGVIQIPETTGTCVGADTPEEEYIWTNKNGDVWPTASWHKYSCSVLAHTQRIDGQEQGS